MLLLHTCIFVLIVSFSSVTTYDFTKHGMFDNQSIELSEKSDTRRRNTPRKGDANAENADKKKDKKKDKKNKYST
ncbi:MAG: hypothetical protein KAG43_04745 [Candidatus Marithrix sp.]|nr:hypothetical protein [Candidatus Marithrix sp.]